MRSIGRSIPLLLLLALPACRSGGPREPATTPPPTTVRVDNRGFPDMTIYVVRGSGERIRLGRATGNSTEVLTIPEYLVVGAERLRFIADPIGGARTPISEEITVSPGDQVVLIIPPQ